MSVRRHTAAEVLEDELVGGRVDGQILEPPSAPQAADELARLGVELEEFGRLVLIFVALGGDAEAIEPAPPQLELPEAEVTAPDAIAVVDRPAPGWHQVEEPVAVGRGRHDHPSVVADDDVGDALAVGRAGLGPLPLDVARVDGLVRGLGWTVHKQCPAGHGEDAQADQRERSPHWTGSGHEARLSDPPRPPPGRGGVTTIVHDDANSAAPPVP